MHFITKEAVAIYKNSKKETDMAFLRLDESKEAFLFSKANKSVKEDIILDLLDDVCFYLFQKTNIYPEQDSLIQNRAIKYYPKSYKNMVGTAYWNEDGYADNLARVRLYRKGRKMIRAFARELKEYFEGKKKVVDEKYMKNVNSFTCCKAVRESRNKFFKFINYDIDEEKKIVKAYFGKDINTSREKFYIMATSVINNGVLRPVRSFYDVDVFFREEFLSRGYVGVSKYNSAEETEPFSIEKGKELAKEDLIKRYMNFEMIIARDNYEVFCKNINEVLNRIDRLLKEVKKQ